MVNRVFVGRSRGEPLQPTAVARPACRDIFYAGRCWVGRLVGRKVVRSVCSIEFVGLSVGRLVGRQLVDLSVSQLAVSWRVGRSDDHFVSFGRLEDRPGGRFVVRSVNWSVGCWSVDQFKLICGSVGRLTFPIQTVGRSVGRRIGRLAVG